MSRLINADALIEAIKKQKDDNDLHCKLCLDAISEIIDEQPTAFDVEAVVKEIEALPRKTKDIFRESKEVPEYFELVRTDYYVKFDDVLEIIRKGGAKNV